MSTLSDKLNAAEKHRRNGNRHEMKSALQDIMQHRRELHRMSQEEALHDDFSDALFKGLVLELDDEEDDSIETAEIAYVNICNAIARTPIPELYKRRLLLLHYFSDYLTEAITNIFLEKFRKGNPLETRNMALECLTKMQLADMYVLEDNHHDFIESDEQLQDACNELEAPNDFDRESRNDAELMHRVMQAFLNVKYK